MYVIKTKNVPVGLLQEFTGEGHTKFKTFTTYGEAHYFASNMLDTKEFVIEKVEDGENDTRELL